MRILLTSVGSRGDMQPMLGLGAVLRRRGHEIIVAAPPNFGDWVRTFGFQFHPVGFDIFAWGQAEKDVARSPLHAARMLTQALRADIATQFTDLKDIIPTVDRVVCTGLQLAASSIAEKHGVPYHFAAFVPGLLKSPSHPPSLLPWATLPPIFNGAAWWLTEAIFGRLLGTLVMKEREAIGLRPSWPFLELFLGRDVLLAVNPILSDVPTDISIPFRQTGVWLLPSDESLPADLEAFLQAGPPPLYLGFGSIPDGNPEETTRMFVRAVRDTGSRALISRGWANFATEALPDGFFAVGSVPHEKLFPRVSGVIHHGGSGTTHTAARAGVPQLVIPHGADQFYWGSRIAPLGLGPPSIHRTKLNRSRLTTALHQMLETDAWRTNARNLGERLRNIDGVANAVRHLEERHGTSARVTAA